MACTGCPPAVVAERVVQQATRFWARYIGGGIYEGGSEVWGKMPADGLLAVKVFFNDDTARNCSGNDEYGLLLFEGGAWTIIHNNETRESNEKRYPNAIWKRGQWTSEVEMREVDQQLAEAV